MLKWMHRRDGGKFIVCIICDCSGPLCCQKVLFLVASVCQWLCPLSDSVLVKFMLGCLLTNDFFFSLSSLFCWMFGNKSSRLKLQIFLIRSDSLNRIIAHIRILLTAHREEDLLFRILCRNGSRQRKHMNVNAKKNDISHVAFYNLQFIKSSSDNLSDFNAKQKRNSSGFFSLFF